MDNTRLNIEALIFASEQSLSLKDIQAVIQASDGSEVSESELAEHVNAIRDKYDSDEFAIALTELNGGYQFLTKQRYYALVHQLQIHKSKKKLSQAALETLAIIAYRQPVTKLEIEQIRGVSCDYTIQRLLEKELIIITGKSDGLGRPILYGTSPLFMDYFGIRNSSELPQLKDIQADGNEIGEKPE